MGTSGRTLRRAATRGAIRCRRSSERKLVIPSPEYDYVRRYWPLLGRLLEELRTLPNVRLAVVFGSVARGEDHEGSDIDLLVALRRDDSRARAEVSERLEAAVGRRVQLVGLAEAERSPLLLADVLRDGRVLVDRDAKWSRLKRREPSVRRRAREDDLRLETEAWAALEHLET